MSQDDVQESVADEVEESVEVEATQADEETNAEVSLEERLEAAEQKATENYEAMLRTKAEMENQRRRSQLDQEKARKFALEKFVNELLPVIDSMEMALSNIPADDEQFASVKEGLEMTSNMMLQAMSKSDVQAIDPTGEKFDPDFHQAMSMTPSDDHESNTVIMVMQKGYTLNGRLVRPALVSVAK